MSTLFQSVPSGWYRTSLRYLAQGPKNGAWGSEAGEDEIDAICVRVADFDWSRLTLKLDDPTTRSFKKQQFKNLQLLPGDIVIEKSGGGEKTPVGRVVSFDEHIDAVTSNFVARIRPQENVWNRYFLYLLAAHYMSGYSHQFIKQNTGIQNLDDTNLFRSDVWIPDLTTQRQIADFLDRETARIDLLIEKKQRLVALLEERRAAAVSCAVTVGLDPNVNLAATRSHYLPRVPTNWRVWRLKHLAQIRGGLTLGRVVPDSLETTTIPYMRVANVQAGWLDLSNIAEIPVTESEKKRYRLIHGDVLMNEGGDNDKLGRGAVWKGEIAECVHQNHVFSVRPHDTRYSDWISLATNARYARDFFYLHSNQSTNLASISKTNLSRFPVAIPPLEEMQSTLEALWQRTGTLETIRKKTNASIDRLKEYRSALITAAVTGQIDVATWRRRGEADRRLEKLEAGAAG